MGEVSDEADDGEACDTHGYHGDDDEGGFKGAHFIAFRWGKVFLPLYVSMIHTV